MYLRAPGKKNNNGMHPIGIIGVEALPFSAGVAVVVQMVHSKDQFSKERGRSLVKKKLEYGNYHPVTVILQEVYPITNLHDLVPKSMLSRLDYVNHQRILTSLIKDESRRF